MDKNTLTPYEKVLTARKQDRPNITEYRGALFDDFIEREIIKEFTTSFCDPFNK